MRKLTPLCKLAVKYQTDKGGWHHKYGGYHSDTCHNYTPTYHALFNHARKHVRHVLEIGVNAGGSLRMWRDYFPKAMIYGIDCRTETMFSEPRIRTFMADQNHNDSLQTVVSIIGTYMAPQKAIEFDIIIDDGSHEEAHQVCSLKNLLPYLAKEGLYIVEDLTVDCHPERVAVPGVLPGFEWGSIPVGVGLGNAMCSCGDCSGAGSEQLLVVRRKPCG